MIALAPPGQNRHLQAQTSTETQAIRHGIAWARGRTWHWQSVAGVQRSPTVKGAGRYHSAGYLRYIERKWNKRRLKAYKLAHRPRVSYSRPGSGGSVQTIICRVFGSHCSTALYIAYRESRYSIYAVNGQYLGLFQMGSHERATYATIGYSTAYQQTVAAHNYYLAAGWGPWTCCEG